MSELSSAATDTFRVYPGVVQTLARGPHAARERFLYAVYYTKS